jgi:hypothetical protein
MQWHRANHADPVIGKALDARGITVDQSMARIQQLMQTIYLLLVQCQNRFINLQLFCNEQTELTF